MRASAVREYRLSLILLSLGIVLVGAVVFFDLGSHGTGSFASAFWAGLALEVVGTAGAMLILLAGTVAYYHRSFVRERERPA